MNIGAYKQSLSTFIAIESNSTNPDDKSKVIDAANWLNEYFKKIGFSTQFFEQPHSNPLVYAEYRVKESLPTVLIYGHYDVMPAQNQEDWKSPPFELTERDGYLYGRGVADNKGQTFIHLFAIDELIKENRLTVNVKVIMEGNEETGNPDLAKFIENHADLLKAHVVLISDGPGIGNQPTIEAALRGGFDMTVTFKSSNQPLHDGLYGGAVPNPTHELSKVIAQLHYDQNQVHISGFYEGVDEITFEQKEIAKKLTPDETTFKQSIGIKSLVKNPDYPFYIQTGLQPNIQVTSFHAGYSGEGYGGTIANLAEAKLNIRLVQNQNPEKVLQLVIDFIKDKTPEYIDLSISHTALNMPVKVDVSQPLVTKIQMMIQNAFGAPAFVRYVGGSIPVISDFQRLLHLDPLVVSLANEDSNEHGPNENMNIAMVEKAYEFSHAFFSSNF